MLNFVYYVKDILLRREHVVNEYITDNVIVIHKAE